jgi:glucose-6-phosphate isomerase
MSWKEDRSHFGAALSVKHQQRVQQLLQQKDEILKRSHDHLNSPIIFDPAITTMAESLKRNAKCLMVVGTGGASLGAQALCSLAPGSQVHFIENCDPATIDFMLQNVAFNETAWLFVSKSGETVETLATALAVLAYYEGKNAKDILKRNCCVLTSAGPRPLRAFAEHLGCATLEHPNQLGGRFSVFSAVGLLPAAFAGMDIKRITDAAEWYWKNWRKREEDVLQTAAIYATSLPETPIHVVMGYADALRPATQWYKQLWAESLGKNGKGPTPMTAIGAIDQHSQLQLYLDGPRDKIFTLILPQVSDKGAVLAKVPVKGMEYLGGHKMGEVMHATAEATVTTLQQHGVPLRVLRGGMDEANLAQLLAQWMIETILVATCLEIDPFSQPAVEEGKRITRAALGYGN